MMEFPKCVAVLVVEDDDSIRETIAHLLESDGYQVYSAATRDSVRAMMPRIPQPALILADLMTPEMNEPWLADTLREGDRVATLPVVGLSTTDPSAPEGYRHVKKPIDLNDLLRIVNAHCERRT